MTVYFSYDADTKLHIPWRDIISDIVGETLAYMNYEKPAEVSVSVVDEDRIKALNSEFRGINKVTDVLSFPLGDVNPETGEVVLGDIVLCAQKIVEQAKEYGHTRKRELAFLTCHSMLHLLGYDHIENEERLVMEELQRKILEKSGYMR